LAQVPYWSKAIRPGRSRLRSPTISHNCFPIAQCS
jgi:hypothetical protein